MQGLEQGEHEQRGERSQALPGLAQPACLGRHIRSSWAVQLAGLRQLQLLPAHHGRGAQGQVGGDAQPGIAAGSFAPLETRWTRASGAAPPGPGTERGMAMELFHPSPAGSGSAPGETSPPWLGTHLGSGMGREEEWLLAGGLQGAALPLKSGFGGRAAPCCNQVRLCPSAAPGLEEAVNGSCVRGC